MNKFFLVTLMIVLSVGLVACQPSAIPQVTVTFTPTPTETLIPAPTLHPAFIELQNIIAQTERFTLTSADEGILILYDGSPLVGIEVGRDGVITLDTSEEKVKIESDKIHFDDEKGIAIDGYEWDEEAETWVEVNLVSETAVTTEIEGNKFSGVGIELDGNNYENNPTLTQEDLPAMRDLLIKLYEEGKIEQFVDKEGDYYHPMQLGNGDLVMLGVDNKFIKNNGWQPMYGVTTDDRNTFVWDDPSNRPRIVGFRYDLDKDGVADGVIFASMLWNKDKIVDIGDWIYAPSGRVNSWLEGGVADRINYTGAAVNGMLVPLDVSDVDACVEYLQDEAVRPFCEGAVESRLARFALQQKKLTSGYVPAELSSGEVISLAAGMPVSK